METITQRELADMLQINRHTVGTRLQRRGIKSVGTNAKNEGLYDREKAIAAMQSYTERRDINENETTLKELAQQFDCNTMTVQAHLKKARVAPTRPPSRGGVAALYPKDQAVAVMERRRDSRTIDAITVDENGAISGINGPIMDEIILGIAYRAWLEGTLGATSPIYDIQPSPPPAYERGYRLLQAIEAKIEGAAA